MTSFLSHAARRTSSTSADIARRAGHQQASSAASASGGSAIEYVTASAGVTLSRPCQAVKERPPRSAEPPLAQAASGPAPGILVDVGGHKLHIRCLGPAGTGPTVILEAGGGGYSNGW